MIIMTAIPQTTPAPQPLAFGRAATEAEHRAIQQHLHAHGIDARKLDPRQTKIQYYATRLDWLKAITVHAQKNLAEAIQVAENVVSKPWDDPQPWGGVLYSFRTSRKADRYIERTSRVKARWEALLARQKQPFAFSSIPIRLAPNLVFTMTGPTRTLPDIRPAGPSN